jgi:hypothetical protein
VRNSTPPDAKDHRRASDVWTFIAVVYIGLIVVCLIAGLKIWAVIDGLLALYAGWRAKHYDALSRTSIDK